jgi:hypothetical protein
MIELLLLTRFNKYDTWRILLVKCYIDNSIRLRSCIRNINSGFFGTQVFELGKLTHEGGGGGETRLMVLTVKPPSVPTLRGGFEWEVEEITVCAGLKADSTDYLALRATRLGGRDVLTLDRLPLEHDTWRQKVVLDEVENFPLIDGGGLEHLGA